MNPPKQQIIEFWHQGLSGGRIAQVLGITRNSAIGVIHRMGLKRSTPPIECVEPATRYTYTPYIPGSRQVTQPKMKPNRHTVIVRRTPASMSKAELRQQLREAVENTIALQCQRNEGRPPSRKARKASRTSPA